MVNMRKRAAEAQRELRCKRKRFRDWPEVVSEWLGQYGEAAWRYMMLILVGKSKLGKSELGKAFKTPERTFCVDCQAAEYPALNEFRREKHDAPLLNEISGPESDVH